MKYLMVINLSAMLSYGYPGRLHKIKKGHHLITAYFYKICVHSTGLLQPKDSSCHTVLKDSTASMNL